MCVCLINKDKDSEEEEEEAKTRKKIFIANASIFSLFNKEIRLSAVANDGESWQLSQSCLMFRCATCAVPLRSTE